MILFQGPDEKEVQEAQNEYMLNYEIPEIDDLEKKYPITYPTSYTSSLAQDMLHLILKGFDSWNKGIEEYIKWTYEAFYSEAEASVISEEKLSLSEYRRTLRNLAKTENIKKLYFDNILIRDEWGTLHYRYRNEDLKTGEIKIGDRMQFLKYNNAEGGLKILSSFTH